MQHNILLDTDQAARVRARFLELLQRHVRGLHIRGNRATGLCPCHDDHHPSFSADLARCFWYCFAMARGGGVKAFAALLGEDISDLFAVPSPKSWAEARRQHADRVALTTAREAYETWCREKLRMLTDQYRELCAEREVLEIAHRQMHRCPELYTPAEQSYWRHRLAAVYDALPHLEWCLDILTYDKHFAERMEWWLEETQSEHT